MRKAILLLILSALLQIAAQAQKPDTLIIYDLATAQESYYPLAAYDTTIRADSMPAHIGILGATAMPTMAPIDTYPGSQISRFIQAADYYSAFNFPFTGITLIGAGFRIVGSLIGPKAILVTTYDLYNGSNKLWRVPTSIYPFYENGNIQYGYSPLTMVRYYLPSTKRSDDFAIIEVAENIGDYGGYFGFAFDSSLAIYDGRTMLYNLTYPIFEEQYNYFDYYPDSANGDTLFMKYGYADWAGVNDRIDFYEGHNGEYVSPFFDDNYRIRAIRWSSNYCPVVSQRSFYFMKHVLSIIPTGIDEIKSEAVVSIFPNPSSTNNIQLTVTNNLLGSSIEVYDANARLVFLSKLRAQSSQLDLPLSRGVYFIRIHSERASVVQRWIKL